MSSVGVHLSQEQLFFPLPFTNATIENVVQVRNLLKSSSQDRTANVISFKVLSAVRHRYSVRPAVGFVGPEQAVTIHFSLDPEEIRRHPDAAARVLPTESTKDAIYIDLAVVPGSAKQFLANWEKSREQQNYKDVQEDATNFWRSRGAVKKSTTIPETNATRRKLQCVFASRDHVPDSLVMCMKSDRHANGVSTHPNQSPVVPTSRPPTMPSTDHRSTSPPDSLPRRVTTGQGTPPSSTPQSSTANRGHATFQPVKSSTGAPAAVHSEEDDPLMSMTKTSLFAAIANYRIPYVVVGLLLVATVFCGLYEHTFLSWLVARL